jgi:hypothetical protein|tara:strand:- start:801 stop:962 length:162 start_codon:yes stop_codon:yes gene_type:complete
MEYYEFHYLIKDLMEDMKAKNDANSGDQDQASGMMSNLKVPNMKVPNMKMPKL